MTAQPYNPGHQIEGLDRCHTVMEMMHFLLDGHPAVLKAEVMPLIEEARAAIHQAYQRISMLEDPVEPEPGDPEDPELLREALDLLEYVTWHDGRYRQESSSIFQRPAQELVTRIAKRLGVEPYQSQKQE
jgi:hypothetical protein